MPLNGTRLASLERNPHLKSFVSLGFHSWSVSSWDGIVGKESMHPQPLNDPVMQMRF